MNETRYPLGIIVSVVLKGRTSPESAASNPIRLLWDRAAHRVKELPAPGGGGGWMYNDRPRTPEGTPDGWMQEEKSFLLLLPGGRPDEAQESEADAMRKTLEAPIGETGIEVGTERRPASETERRIVDWQPDPPAPRPTT